MRNAPERSKATLAAELLRRVYLSPDTYTVPVLARDLGEGERRVQRILADIELGGWDVERGADYRLTIKPAVRIPNEG